MTLTLIAEKMTRKEVLEIAHRSSVISFLWPSSEDFLYADRLLHEALPTLPKVISSMPEFESNPAVWVFHDPDLKMGLLIWSDVHRKNCFKGTALECFSLDNSNIPYNSRKDDKVKLLKKLTSYLETYLKNKDPSIDFSKFGLH